MAGRSYIQEPDVLRFNYLVVILEKAKANVVRGVLRFIVACFGPTCGQTNFSSGAKVVVDRFEKFA